VLALVVLAAYPLLFIVQGIDFTDMGFNLSNQWLLLEDADSYRHGHLFYLSNFLGGLWLAVSAPLGLVGAKLGWALVIYGTMYAAYRTLEPYGDRAGLVGGLIVAMLWSTRLGTTWISYNSLTALFFTCAALLLVRGLTGDRTPPVVAAGALLGAAIFVRLPNLLAFALVAVVPLYAYLARHDRRWALRQVGAFVLGYGAGVAAVLLLLLVLGHLPLYWESLGARFFAATGDESYEYSGGKLIGKLLRNYADLAYALLLTLPVLLLAARALSARWHWQLVGLVGIAVLWYLLMGQLYVAPRMFMTLLLVAVLVLAAMFWLRRAADGAPVQMVSFIIGTGLLMALGYYFTRLHWPSSVPGMLYAALAFRFWRTPGADDRLVTVVAAMILAITPLGSGNGIVNAIFGMWLAIPLALMTLLDVARAAAPRLWYRRSAVALVAVTCASLVLLALDNAGIAAYRDSHDRTRMTATIDHPFLRGALTTPERARVVDELLGVLPDYVAPGDPLLLHGDCPLLHLLSRTRPVLGSTWNGVYNERMFNELLRGYEQSEPANPVVLIANGSCRDRNWPEQQRITLTGYRTGLELHEFMGRHAYELRWENKFFEIWSPVPSGARG